MKPDSEKSYLEQAKDTISGKADVSRLVLSPTPRFHR